MLSPEMKKLRSEIRKIEAKEPNFLRQSIAKRLFQRAFKITLDYNNLVEIFGRRQRTLERVISEHRLKKPRVHQQMSQHWPDCFVAVVRRFYEASQFLKSRKESPALTSKMVAVINQLRAKKGLPPVSANAIVRVAALQRLSDPTFPLWGWSSGSATLKARRCVFEKAVQRSASITSDEEFHKLVEDLAARFQMTVKSLNHRLVELGLRWHYHPRPRPPYRRKKFAAGEFNVSEDKKWLESL